MEKAFYPVSTILLISLLFVLPPAFAKDKDCDAIIISGGAYTTSNHERYYRNITSAHNALPPNCTKFNVVADGPNSKIKNYVPNNKSGNPLYDKSTGLILTKKMNASDVTGGIYREASPEGVLAAFSQVNTNKKEGPIVVYVTDHGSGDTPDNRAIVLWNKNGNSSKLTVGEFRKLVQQLPPNRQLITMHDQCFGGAMLEGLWDDNGKIRPNSCGFAAATKHEFAFNGGGIMKTVESMKKWEGQGTYFDVFNELKDRADSEGDDASIHERPMFSTPISSSEIFIDKYLKQKFITDKMDLEDTCLPDIKQQQGWDQLVGLAQHVLLWEHLSKMKSRLENDGKKCQQSRPPKDMNFDLSRLSFNEVKKQISDHESDFQKEYRKSSDEFFKWNDKYYKILDSYIEGLPTYKKMQQAKNEMEELTLARQDGKKINEGKFQREKKAYAKDRLGLARVKKALSPKGMDWKPLLILLDFLHCKGKGCPRSKTMNRKQVRELLEKKYGETASMIITDFYKRVKGRKDNEGILLTDTLKMTEKAQDEFVTTGIDMRTCRRFYHRLSQYVGINEMIKQKDKQNLQDYLGILACENTEI